MSVPPPPKQCCPLCGHALTFFDTGVVLERYDAEFFRCGGCGLISNPDPYWLAEAYANPIFAGDLGLERRNKVVSTLTSAIIRAEGLRGGRFLDWGGGHGTLTQIMRGRGHDFHTYDAYADNTLAVGHTGDPDDSYDLVTAFEVLEHLTDPVADLRTLAANNDRIFVSTQLQPPPPAEPPRPSDWWYYQLESGQHITLYSRTALQQLADRLDLQLTSNGDQFHLFHKVPLSRTTRTLLSPRIAGAKVRAATAVRRLRGPPT